MGALDGAMLARPPNVMAMASTLGITYGYQLIALNQTLQKDLQACNQIP
jgi:hypothetical protein